ncbi:MAG TPA: two-component regulator propeller domain-containing protein, partial [Chitinispirillaceae bacterium]|nr:two-component regulator propeller domain-containing protein [Chitinispirillaceae bacterium]
SVLPGNSVTSLLTDKHENVWAAVNGGIVRYSKNESWNTFPASGDSIPGRDVSALALDSSGVIWAGFKQPIYMSSIQSGIASFNGEHWRKIQTTHVSIKKVVIDKNNDLWIVSENGVSRITENQDTVVFQTKSSSVRDVALGTMVNTIAFDNNNTPWIGTGLGIKRYENSVWIDDTTLKQFLPQTGILSSGVNVNCLHFDNDTLWIGTSMGLFKRYENTCLHYDTTASMLPDMNVQCIKTNRLNGVWVGTRGGLVQMAGEKHAIYTTDNTPLIDNDITACVVASDGNIWIGTRKGGVTILERSSVASNMSTGTNFKGGSYDKSVKKSVSVSFKKFANSTSVISVQTEQPSSIQFDLYTLQGKKIRSFHVKSSGTGPATICWNGTDRFNRKVASGVLTGVVTINGSIVEKVTISK